MIRHYAQAVRLVALCLFVVVLLAACLETTPTLNSDKDVLVEFYKATDGPNWIDNTNWLSDAPIGEWYGVTAGENGSVIELVLDGTLFERHGLRGEVPGELGSLTDLERLSLNWNELSGEIPSELGNLANLQELQLNGNQLSGEVPSWLFSLTNLKSLDLGVNQLSGDLSPKLGELTDLEELNLGPNRLSGKIPTELGELGNLKSCTSLAIN